VLVFVAFFAAPFITIFATSLTRWNGFTEPRFVGFANYVRLFQSGEFLLSLRNLLYWYLIAATFHVALGVVVAFLIYHKYKGSRVIRTVYMIPEVVSMAAWAMIYRFIFNNQFGILNGFIRLFDSDFTLHWFYESPAAFWAVTMTWVFSSVYATLITYAELVSIPSELHDSARIDGASQWQTTLRIDLPMIRYSIGTCVILSTTARLGMFEQIYLTTKGGPGDDTMNIPLIIVKHISALNHGYANSAAATLVVLGVMTMWLFSRVFKMNRSSE